MKGWINGTIRKPAECSTRAPPKFPSNQFCRQHSRKQMFFPRPCILCPWPGSFSISHFLPSNESSVSQQLLPPSTVVSDPSCQHHPDHPYNHHPHPPCIVFSPSLFLNNVSGMSYSPPAAQSLAPNCATYVFLCICHSASTH